MEKDNLKLIVRNLELLIDALKSEIYSDKEAYVSKQENFDDPVSNYITDYDEIFEDDDG
tara:strand:+ start:238 stop:414 length:177 start_codon:yes stop_codon:yes gene_type:complete